jgi:hypothetical protein
MGCMPNNIPMKNLIILQKAGNIRQTSWSKNVKGGFSVSKNHL